MTDIENAGLPNREESGKIEQLKHGEFFSSLPRTKIAESKLAADIELLFYMGIILDLDFISHYRSEDMGRSFRKREYSRTSIAESPTSKKYPTAARRMGIGGLSAHAERMGARLGR